MIPPSTRTSPSEIPSQLTIFPFLISRESVVIFSIWMEARAYFKLSNVRPREATQSQRKDAQTQINTKQNRRVDVKWI